MGLDVGVTITNFLALNILVLALIVDALTGEPSWLYRRIAHPVVWMAKFLELGEKHLNKPVWHSIYRRTSGILLILAGVLLMGFLGWFFEKFLQDAVWGHVILVLLLSTLLAGRSLYNHVVNVFDALEGSEDLVAARKEVAMIIGRHSDDLDEPGISRAAIESLAENFSDGVVAPAFWYLIAGLPGILIYKMVNTADSMIGNRSERYEAFGWAAARLDDLMNIVPARLTALLFVIAALPFGKGISAFKAAMLDAGKHLSPNAGWPEAAMAGALGIRLGGPRQYPGDVVVDGAWLGNSDAPGEAPGETKEETTPDHITRGLKIMVISWGLMLVMIIFWNEQF